LRDRFHEIAVGGRDHAQVDLHWSGRADTLDLALLEDAQQLRLCRKRELADLVEKQRAASGKLDLAWLGAGRTGEGAALVAEQLALDELARQRCAVDRDKGAPARREARWMKRASTSLPVPLSPRAGSSRRWPRALHRGHDVAHRSTVAEDEPMTILDGATQRLHIAAQPARL